ncbi:MAG: sulfatase-like hydrolase/transferase [Acidobacteria bacterium]|nr:sulfatase-like hydrolase/transferase [Acidobacteriota bacterium]
MAQGRKSRYWRYLACAALLLLSLSARPAGLGAAEAKPNVIVISIDTLRADRLGCYGYRQIETPAIDALAQSAARFTRAYTPVPITLPAHVSIFTGSFPMGTGIHDFVGNKLPAGALTLAEVLRDNGYTTAAFLGSAVLDSRFGLNQGFGTYFDHFDLTRADEASLDRLERRGDRVIDEALSWLKRNPRQPFFLWIHLYDPHAPYRPPEPFARRYRARPYDGEIAFADAQVGRLFSFLKAADLFSSSLIALTSDHGEGLGEHGEVRHGFFIYNSTLQVPLLIKVPGVAPRVIEEDVSLVDLMPTLLQALRIPIPPAVQGRSLLGEMLGRHPSGRSILYAETYLPLLHFRWSHLRGLQSGGLKYIDAPRPELYDIRTDPGETRNLFQTRQALAHELRGRLLSLVRRYTPGSEGLSSEKEPTDPALLDRLRSLGYVAVSAGSLADADLETLPDPKDRIGAYELFWEAAEHEQQGRYDDWLRKLREAERAEPRCLPVRYLIALNHFHKRDFPQAIEGFRSTLELNPKFLLAPYYLGLAYAQISNYEAAAVSFKKALELDSANYSAALGLGSSYIRIGRIEDAIRAFERAIRVNPSFAPAYEGLGEVFLHQGRVDEAIKMLERAVALAPAMKQAHYHLGRAYKLKGLEAQAEEEFRRARSP